MSIDRGAWQATVHGVSKSQTWLSTGIHRGIKTPKILLKSLLGQKLMFMTECWSLKSPQLNSDFYLEITLWVEEVMSSTIGRSTEVDIGSQGWPRTMETKNLDEKQEQDQDPGFLPQKTLTLQIPRESWPCLTADFIAFFVYYEMKFPTLPSCMLSI